MAIGSSAHPALIHALKHHEDEDVRRWCATAFGLIEQDAKNAVPHLIEALDDRRWGVREQAIFALYYVDLAPKQLVPVIAAKLNDDHEFVRYAAVVVLGELGPSAADAIPDLVDLIDQERDVDDRALYSLKDIDTAAAIHHLNRIIRDENHELHIGSSAVFALADPHMGRTAVDSILEILQDGDSAIQKVVRDALVDLEESASPTEKTSD